MSREKDDAAKWTKGASPDDDYIPPVEPPNRFVKPEGPRNLKEVQTRRVYTKDDGLGIVDVSGPVGDVCGRCDGNKTVDFGVGPIKCPECKGKGRYPREKLPNSDGLIETALGELTPREFRDFQKRGFLNKDGLLAESGDASPRSRQVRNRRGGKGNYQITPTLEDQKTAKERRVALLARIQRAIDEGEIRDVWRTRWVRNKPPPSPAARKFTPKGDWIYLDEGDNFRRQDGTPVPSLGRRGQVSQRERDSYRFRLAPSLEDEFRTEIKRLRAAGDPRFAPDAVKKCGNPNNCPSPVKGRGTRCSPCYKFRRDHRGEERPARLINRQVRRGS